MHWGLWGDPDAADGSVEDFRCAAENLSRRVCDAAGIADGMRVLDVGCGFGGTIASLDRRFGNLDLVGLNLEERQLEKARRQVVASPSNRIRWVGGDACALPFEDDSFDAVLAVECVFHFPSRRRFLTEAARVLRPGGRLALSDFLLPERESTPALLERALITPLLGLLFGPVHGIGAGEFAEMARASGLEPREEIDITAATLPTYAVLERLVGSAGLPGRLAGLLIRPTADAQRRRRFLYEILAFEAGAAAHP